MVLIVASAQAHPSTLWQGITRRKVALADFAKCSSALYPVTLFRSLRLSPLRFPALLDKRTRSRGGTGEGAGWVCSLWADGKKRFSCSWQFGFFKCIFFNINPSLSFLGALRSPILPLVRVNSDYWWLPSERSPPGWHQPPMAAAAECLFKAQHGRRWKASARC